MCCHKLPFLSILTELARWDLQVLVNTACHVCNMCSQAPAQAQDEVVASVYAVCTAEIELGLRGCLTRSLILNLLGYKLTAALEELGGCMRSISDCHHSASEHGQARANLP